MEINKNVFGNWSIDIECFNKILELIPSGSSILEFGSGKTTEELKKYYNLTSIEHDKRWINGDGFIYAPLKKINNNIYWYDLEKIKNISDKKYDLILVDGPPSTTLGKREGFFHNLNLFNLENTIIIFDDIHRDFDLTHLIKVSKKLKRKYEVFNSGNRYPKKFGVIYKK